MKLTLTNARHFKTLTLGCLMRQIDYKGSESIEISRTTYNKIKNRLCGLKDCDCGINNGQSEYSVVRDNWPDKSVYRYFIVTNKRV